jgi:hypothetical protein
MAPKYAYLDQNQWIYLARDYWGKPLKQAHRGIAQQLLAKVNSGQLRLPLSTIHFIEHLRAENPARRQRLAKVFDLFSGGWYVASWALVLPTEIRQAVAKAFGDLRVVPPPQVFGRGFLFGLGPVERETLYEGRSDERVELLEQIASLPGAILDLLTFPNESGRRKQNEKVGEIGAANVTTTEDLRQIRRSEPIEVHRRAQYAGYTLDHQDFLLPALAAIGRTWDDFRVLSLDGLLRFWADVPSLDVDCELTLYRDRQWTRCVHENDVRDIAQLVLAVPYCDVVVTERFWTRAAVATGISEKYRTKVCPDLADLLDLVC